MSDRKEVRLHRATPLNQSNKNVINQTPAKARMVVKLFQSRIGGKKMKHRGKKKKSHSRYHRRTGHALSLFKSHAEAIRSMFKVVPLFPKGTCLVDEQLVRRVAVLVDGRITSPPLEVVEIHVRADISIRNC